MFTAIGSARRWTRGRLQERRQIAELLPVAGVRLVVPLAAVNVLLGLLPLGFVIGMSATLDRIPQVATHRPNAWAALLVAFWLSTAAAVVQNLLAPVSEALGFAVTRTVDGKVIARLMEEGLKNAPMAVLESPEVLDKLAQARDRLYQVQMTPGAAVTGMLAVLVRYSNLLGLVVAVGVVLTPLAAILLMTATLAVRLTMRTSLLRWIFYTRPLMSQERRWRYVADTGADVSVAKDMRVLAVLPWFQARARSEANAYVRRTWHRRRQIFVLANVIMGTIGPAGVIAILLILRGVAVQNRITILGLSLVLQAVLILPQFGEWFPESDGQTLFGTDALRTMHELRELFSPRTEEVPPGRQPADGLPMREMRFEGVHFTYPGTDREVLSGLDLTFQAGRSTAVVGLTGSGKTTLVKLLARLYEPTSGQILTDGIELRQLDARAWQQRMAVIFQDFVRYELDAESNIGLGAPRLGYDVVAVRKAAAWAGAAPIVAGLPSGLATPLSSRYAGGVDLSGGQWQRIALARARMAIEAGASILILDEPTAQLDARAEVAFFERFLELTAGLTTIVISHRFSTVRRADRIVVLAQGRVVEDGTHDELLARGGQYARLFEFQARRFRAPGMIGQ